MIVMTDCFHIGIQYLTALLEIGFLYIWLRAFAERRKLNRVMVSVVILCFAAVRCYTNCMENTVLAMILEAFCCLLISVLLFNERYRSLFFYTVANYMLVAVVEFLTGGSLPVLTGMVLLFVIYYYMKKSHALQRVVSAQTQALEALNVRLELESKHYKNMDDLHEQYDVYMHDMKHTMRAIAALAEEGDYESISSLIDKMRIKVGNIEQKIICSNKILNALLLERRGYAEDNGVVMEMEIREPLYFQEIDEPDFISLLGNLLDNAIEAEKSSKKRDGILLNMRMAREGMHMIIHLENSYKEDPDDKKFRIKRSGSIGDKHGIGLESVRDIVRKYGGIIENEKSEDRYFVKVILPVQSEWEGQKSYPDSTPAYLQLLSK